MMNDLPWEIAFEDVRVPAENMIGGKETVLNSRRIGSAPGVFATVRGYRRD